MPPRRPKKPPRRLQEAPRRLQDLILMDFWKPYGDKLAPKPHPAPILCESSVKAQNYYFCNTRRLLQVFDISKIIIKSNKNRSQNNIQVKKAPRYLQEPPRVPKNSPRRLQDALRPPQEGPPRSPKRPPRCAKMLPRDPKKPQEAPRDPQEMPKTPPGRPQEAPKRPKTPPGGPKNPPRRPQTTPCRLNFGIDFESA